MLLTLIDYAICSLAGELGCDKSVTVGGNPAPEARNFLYAVPPSSFGGQNVNKSGDAHESR